MNIRLVILLVCFLSSSVFATSSVNNSIWKNLEGASDASRDTRLFSLDSQQFISQMDSAAATPSGGLAKSTSGSSFIVLPLPSGKTIKLEATEYSIMEQGAKVFGDFRSWKVRGVDEPTTTGVIDISSNGFHAMLFLTSGETVFIEPADLQEDTNPSLSSLLESSEHIANQAVNKRSNRQKNIYKSFTRSSIKNKSTPFACGVHSTDDLVSLSNGQGALANQSGLANKGAPANKNRQVAYRRARNLRVYRIAMAATGEFTQFFLSRGLNPNLAINTILTRVNVIYNRDLAIDLELVADNSLLVFSNPNRDPYPINSDSSLLVRNTDVIDSIIGSGAYDIGHVLTRFSTNTNGGVALLGSVCVDSRDNNSKGAGTTGANDPSKPAFAIDFVAHELGHQLGATHTFNSITGSCGGANRQAETAFEPGGGSSVMAYAGICGRRNNVVDHSLSIFHIESINQINQNVLEGRGDRCGSDFPTFNEAPDITGITSGLTVNAGEKFTLSGSAVDANGDALSFAWDQVDSGRVSNKFVDLGDNALFEVKLPSASATREFDGLALTNRNLHFKLVVRDGRGGVSSAETTVNVINGGTPSPGNSFTDLDDGSGGKIDFLLFLLFFTVMIVSNRGFVYSQFATRVKKAKVSRTGEKNV